jgi:hypothetical protein
MVRQAHHERGGVLTTNWVEYAPQMGWRARHEWGSVLWVMRQQTRSDRSLTNNQSYDKL